MKLEEIMGEWSKDCNMDETELGTESTKIPVLHNKYLKIFTTERYILQKSKAEYKRTKRKLLEYYLGELDREELSELGRDQVYKKILKNEVDTYIESDEMMIDVTLKVAMQQEKIDFLDSVIKQINNRGFQIKNAIDWMKFING